MLRALVELAERERLVASSGFEPRPVDFEIRLDRAGRFVRLVCLRDARGAPRTLLAPRAPRRSVNVCPGFLVDNARYVLGVGDPPLRAERCRSAFADRIERALTGEDDPALAAVARFYADFAPNRAALFGERPRAEWSGSEVLGFSIEGFGPAHDRAAARQVWMRAQDGQDEGAAARCLVTGRVVPPARLHPVIRLPGGQPAGASLVSFNADAFRSHGLEQGANAPVAPDAAIAYVAALHRLLERDDHAARAHRYGVRLGRDLVAVFWTTAPMHTLDFFADLWNGPRPGAADAFHAAPWNGEPPAALDRERFYAVILGTNAARAVVRDWFETSLGAVKRATRRFADDLAIAGDSRPLAVWQLLAAVEPPGGTGLAPDLACRIFLSSLRGSPLPREVLRQTLQRMRTSPDRWRHPAALLHARAALIRATLRGIGRADPTMSHLQEVPVSLDEGSTQAAYSLGRLFAALERAQQRALSDPNASMRDRYFSAASMAPAQVFPRLLRLAQHRADPRRARGSGPGPDVDDTIARMVARLPASGFPVLLSIEDQGLFAVGYYHQREAFVAAPDPTGPGA
ncbi:MAG TPA: type I-C CRISPR-associated protein Cas8c/Csd1 [Kofleriaceae bacterium]|nr:type I-C CRISPR-associated protein Cas8c/Csd1 [Kofleriaceae bacterium]